MVGVCVVESVGLKQTRSFCHGQQVLSQLLYRVLGKGAGG